MMTTNFHCTECGSTTHDTIAHDPAPFLAECIHMPGCVCDTTVAELRERVEAAIPPCYLYRDNAELWEREGFKPVVCLDLVGGRFTNDAVWTLEMCCDPCKISHALHGGDR